MKSLALHLIAILLVGSLLHTNANENHQASATTAAASTTTTTLQPPSLRAPHRLPPTTVMTTTPTTTSAVRRQPQQPAARRSSSSSTSQAHANHFHSMANDEPTTSSPFASTRLVSNAAASTTTANGLRQNRSLQRATAVAAQHNSNNNNDDAATNSNNNNHKYKRLERRHHFRTNQHSSISSDTIALPAAATPTPKSSDFNDKDDDNDDDSSSSSQQHQPQQHQSPSTFMANHRQSKYSSMPLDGGGGMPAEHAIATRNSTKLPQTSKTPRMIQRLVAGHIQNAQGRSTYQVSAVSTNSSVTNSSTTLKPSALYFRRKQPVMSSSYRHAKLNTTPRSTAVATTTSQPLRLQNTLDTAEDRDDHDDDEALLDDPGDFDNWDNGILRLSAGAGKEGTAKSKKSKEDSKKTLSDQVRDGKYGLIEKEIFRREPKRPGVLSYLPNKEVPTDNERNFGGLDEEDIWLAEDHLLVIKGGSLNEGEPREPWPPIDDYDSPARQIKIPAHPKVPPPFPVQLEENGPVQFIGNNKFTVVYPVANESIPVYSAGPETYNTPSESDSDNEKNLIARPGSTKDIAEGEPGYLYPAPYPPWLFHNQTFVNPFLSNARPITFPGLGPFPLGRNGSLDNSNGTDDFDEDDPSLYYPPAYSFVYKSNYSNPVSPGPLVPGIVLPPPANQFSRLEKPLKNFATTSSAPPRHRIYTTSCTSTITTSTTTTSTTTPIPFRQTITKISEYIPKTIHISPSPPDISSPIPPTPITKLPPTPPPSPIEPVPVPVAVHIPIYPSNHQFPTSRPNAVAFVPTSPKPTTETLSKTNPIYYEYFEAKRQQPSTPNVIDEFLSTTTKPAVSPKPIKLYATSKRPFKTQSHRNYLQPIPPNRHFVQENVVYITPKPEIRYQPQAQAPIFKPRPLNNFEREVSAIRETLRYYQNQQLRDNSIPRTPKAKPIYEYSYDATKNLQPVATEEGITNSNGNFQPPARFDDEPFQPMVTYSPPVDDENAFRAIAYDKVDNGETGQQQQQQQQPKYQSTTTLVPVQPEPRYQERPKKLRLGAKHLQQPLIGGYQPQARINEEYQSTPRTILSTQRPWVSLDKQELNEYAQQQQQQQHHHAERLQMPPPGIASRNRGFNGYYYGPPQQPGRQNNRFYDEPFHNPVRKIINYRPPHQQQPQQQQQHQPNNVWSLENDTYVNFAPNRPPLNPDAEFINPYHHNPYTNQGQRLPLPALSHQAQYYAPPQRFPQQIPPQRQYHPQQQQQQQQIPLHRDILVNYRQPLPPINPDSEYISQPQVVRNQANQFYRSNAYRLPPPPPAQQQQQQQQQPPTGNGGEQSNVYYITPKYRRANANNNNNGNSNINAGSDN